MFQSGTTLQYFLYPRDKQTKKVKNVFGRSGARVRVEVGSAR